MLPIFRLLIASLLASISLSAAEKTVRPAFFVIATRDFDVTKIIDAANHHYLRTNLLAAQAALSANQTAPAQAQEELRLAQAQMQAWKPGDPIPVWVENVIVHESDRAWCIAYYPRNAGVQEVSDAIVINHRGFVCHLSKLDYSPLEQTAELPKIQWPTFVYGTFMGKKLFSTRYPGDEPGFENPMNKTAPPPPPARTSP